MRGGVYRVNGKLLHETEYAAEIHGWLPNSFIQPLLENQMQELVGFVGCDVMSRGADAIVDAAQQVQRQKTRAILFDAATDEEIERIAEAGKRLSLPILWVGSAGLANAVATRLDSTRDEEQKEQLQRNGNVISHPHAVVVAGSRNSVTLRQLEYLKERHQLCHLTLKVDSSIQPQSKLQEASSQSCLITFDTMDLHLATSEGEPISAAEYSLQLASRIGGFAASVIMENNIKHIIATGGDTAAAICRYLEADFMEVMGQVQEAIPVLRLHGGPADGAIMVTKAGGFGAEDSLFKAVTQMVEWHDA